MKFWALALVIAASVLEIPQDPTWRRDSVGLTADQQSFIQSIEISML
jgi:hypothetical protein